MGGADYRVEVHGSVGGNLVVGDHNLIVNAAQGSSVTVLQEAERPKPVRRSSVRVLPRRPAGVLGRDAERGTIAAAVVAQSTLQVFGPPGIGKSTLLRQAAYDVADEADGVIFLTAGGRSHLDVPQEIFEGAYDTSGFRPGPTELRRLLTGVRVCVVADDLVCSPDELLTILDAAPDAAFVLAAPDRELWGQGQTIELRGLSGEAALALVRREVGRDLSPSEHDAVVAEWRAGAGSPMRLLRTAASLAQQAPLKAAHPDPGHAIGTAHVPQPPRSDPRPVDDLPPRERDVLALLGYIAPASATVPVIAALAGAHDLGRVSEAAEHLVRAGLADATGSAEAAYQIADDLAVRMADRRFRRDSAALATALLAWIDAGATPADVAAHGDLVVALIEAAVRDGHADLGTRLARAAAPLAALSLRWGVWRDVLTSGQAAATSSEDREAYAYFTHERGIRMLCLGQAAAAAAVLATAAGLWQALGLTHSAAIASAAQTIATGATPVAHIPAQHVVAHEVAPRHVDAPAQHGPEQHHRAVGHAHVDPVPKPFPVALVSGLALAVIAIVVAAILVGPHLLHSHAGPTAAGQPSPTQIATSNATPSASPTPTVTPLPPPAAFADNTADGTDPMQVLDNDPATIWSTRLARTPKTDDAWVAIDMGGQGTWTGISLTPRQGGSGFPRAFRLESSDDMLTWTPIPGQTYNADHPYTVVDGAQTITFGTPVRSRYVRLFATELGPVVVATSVAVSNAYALQLAEMHVLN